MRLFLAGHGATQHNLDGRLTGQIDAPLSALGQRVTAEAIARRHPLPVQLDADIREIDMGSWAGRAYAEWTSEERLRFEAMEHDPTRSVAAPGVRAPPCWLNVSSARCVVRKSGMLMGPCSRSRKAAS